MTFRDRLKATFSDALAASKNADQHTRSYYTDQATLEFIVDCADVDREISLLAQDAPANSAHPGRRRRRPRADRAERLQCSTGMERRTPPSPDGGPGTSARAGALT